MKGSIIYDGHLINTRDAVEDVSRINYRLKVDILRHTDIYGYEHCDNYIELTRNGWLTAKCGYGWDGGTGVIDTPRTLIGSLFHDVGYQLIRCGALPYRYKRLFDAMLRDTMLEQAPRTLGLRQVAQARAWIWWTGVRLVGRWGGNLGG